MRPSQLVSLGVALLAPSIAAAEINVADSLEWMVADSDLVVRGRVIAVTSTRGPGQVVYERVRVRIDETFKGPASQTVEVLIRDFAPLGHASRWRADRTELILFLVDSKRRVADDPKYATAAFALRGGSHDGSAIRLSRLPTATNAVAFTMEQRLLSSRPAIIAATRAAGRFRGIVKPRPFRIDVDPSTPVYRRLWAGSSVWLMVPIDRRLETHARAALRSKNFGERLEAVRALGNFKSAANIALMKQMLGDPGFHVESRGAQRTKVFAVREAALKNLRRWGTHNLTPTVRVPLP